MIARTRLLTTIASFAQSTAENPVSPDVHPNRRVTFRISRPACE